MDWGLDKGGGIMGGKGFVVFSQSVRQSTVQDDNLQRIREK